MNNKKTFGWYFKNMLSDIFVLCICISVVWLAISLSLVPKVYGVGIVMLCYSVPMTLYMCVKLYREYKSLRDK